MGIDLDSHCVMGIHFGEHIHLAEGSLVGDSHLVAEDSLPVDDHHSDRIVAWDSFVGDLKIVSV